MDIFYHQQIIANKHLDFTYIVLGCHFLGTLDDNYLMMLRFCYFGGWMMDGWMMTIRCCGFVTLVVWNDISNAFSALSSCNLRFPFMLISGSICIFTFFIFFLTSPLAIVLTCPLLKFSAMIHFRRQHFPLVVVLE